jgi:hypothetical protein
MPFLLLCGMGFSTFFAGIGALAYMAILLMLPFTTHFTLNGQSVTRPEFLASIWPLLLAYPFPLVLFGTIAYALWREKPWTRTLMMGLWGLGAVAAIAAPALDSDSQSNFPPGIIGLVLCAAVASWYLYGSKAVRSYYAALRGREKNQNVAPAGA